jgi:magnesium transporter
MVSTAPATAPPLGACTTLVYRQGEIRQDVPDAEIDRALRQQDSVVWVDIQRPTEENFRALVQQFGLHPLAVEDVHTAHQRPKLDRYGDARLIVLFDAQLTPSHRRVVLREVDLFVGANYVVTVHRFPAPCLTALRERWLHDPTLVEPDPNGFLLYHLADGLIDTYFPVADALETKIARIEQRLLSGFDRAVLREILLVRRDLLQFRKVLGPQRDVFGSLSRHEDPLFDNSTVAYFADLVDHLLRVAEAVDVQRELLGAALESYRSNQSYALGEVVKRMTALTITLMVPTLIAGVYGMNFQYMPELQWLLGYPWALGLMALAVAITLLIFRRHDWL